MPGEGGQSTAGRSSRMGLLLKPLPPVSVTDTHGILARRPLPAQPVTAPSRTHAALPPVPLGVSNAATSRMPQGTDAGHKVLPRLDLQQAMPHHQQGLGQGARLTIKSEHAGNSGISSVPSTASPSKMKVGGLGVGLAGDNDSGRGPKVLDLRKQFEEAQIQSQNSKHTRRIQALSKGDDPTSFSSAAMLERDEEYIVQNMTPVRRAVRRLVDHPSFDRFILLCIFVNFVIQVLELERPDLGLSMTEIYWASLFSAEALARIFAWGLLRGRKAYFNDAWNWFDFTIVVISWVSLLPGVSNYSGLRALRVLRSLRTLNAIEGLRKLSITLVKSLKPLMSVVILWGFLFLTFGVIGLQMFGGKLSYRCREDSTGIFEEDLCDIEGSTGRKCPDGWTCARSPDGNPNYDVTKFDNILWAFLTIFQCMTSEGWTDIMYDVMDATGPVIAVIYFILLTVTGAIFVVNLALAVVAEKFSEADHTPEPKLETPSKITLWLKNMSSVIFKSVPAEELPRPHNQETVWGKIRGVCTIIILSRPFNAIMMLAIIANTAFLSFERYQIPESEKTFLSNANYVFVVLFSLELFLKNMSMGIRGYVSLPMNRFDCVIVAGAWIEVFVTTGNSASLSALRVLRLLRALKLLRSLKSVRLIVKMISDSLNSMASLSLILLLFVLISGMLGQILFANKFDFEDGKPRSNFDNFFISCITIFQILTGENWNEVMYSAVRAEGNPYISIFFLVIFIIGQYMLLNLFLAILLSAVDLDAKLMVPAILKKPDKKKRRSSFARNSRSVDASTAVSEAGITRTTSGGVRTPSPSKSNAGKVFPASRNEKQPNPKSYPVQKDAGAAKMANLAVGTGHDEQVKQSNADQPTNRSQMLSPDGSNSKHSGMGAMKASGLLVMQHSKHKGGSSRPSAERIQREEIELSGSPLQEIGRFWVNSFNFLARAGADYDPEDPNQSNKVHPLSSSVGASPLLMSGGSNASPRFSSGMKANQVLDVLVEQTLSPTFLPDKAREEMFMKTLEEDEGIQWVYQDSDDEEEDLSSASQLQGKSLMVFKPNNVLRVIMKNVVQHRYFERFILLCIAVSSVSLAVETPNMDPNGDKAHALQLLDRMFAVIFLAEAVMKIITYGFIRGRSAYLRSSWNVLDFIIVVFALIDWFLARDLKALRALRTIRMLRPLRAIQRAAGLRIVVQALLDCIPVFFNIALILLVVYLMFGIIGIHFFAGKFHTCSIDISLDEMDCIAAGGVWTEADANFDDIFHALLTLFEVATTENWLTIMNRGMDARGVGLAPVRNHQPAMALYFVVFMLVGSFLALNLFSGAVVDNFNRLTAKDRSGGILLSDDQKSFLLSLRAWVRRLPDSWTPDRPKSSIRAWLFDTVQTPRFEFFIMGCIMLNVVVMASEYDGAPESFTKVLEVANYVFAAIFTVECIIKLVALSPAQYFHSGWNSFDFTIVVLTAVGLASNLLLTSGSLPVSPTVLRSLRLFRVVRLFRLLKKSGGVVQLLEALMYSIPALLNVLIILALVYFIFATMGVSFFGHVKHGESLTRHANFETFGSALLTLFRMSTGENWNGLMHDCMVHAPNCNPGVDCGSRLAPIYFVGFQVVGPMLILNMVIAVLLDNLQEVMRMSEHSIMSSMVELGEAWKQLDPSLTLTLPTSHLLGWLRRIPPPLGIPANASRAQALKYVLQLNLLDRGGLVYFTEVARALLRSQFQEDRSDPEFDHKFDMLCRRLLPARVRHMPPADFDVPSVFSSLRIQAAWRARRLTRSLLLGRMAKDWDEFERDWKKKSGIFAHVRKPIETTNTDWQGEVATPGRVRRLSRAASLLPSVEQAAAPRHNLSFKPPAEMDQELLAHMSSPVSKLRKLIEQRLNKLEGGQRLMFLRANAMAIRQFNMRQVMAWVSTSVAQMYLEGYY